jgi:hypothetical protein
MPTNLPPDYFEAERRYRAAETPAEKIACLEEMLSLIPRHKGTEHLVGDLRHRLAKLKASTQVRKKTGRQESAWHFDREGVGQVVVVGPTNVGKSALVEALTKASPEVSAAPLTTWRPTPGMMPVENVQIQLVDTPPLNPEFVEPELMNLVRRADMVLLMVDLQADPLEQLDEAVKVLEDHRIVLEPRLERAPAEARITVKPVLVVANKADDEGADEDYEILCQLIEEEWPILAASVTTGRNLEQLKQQLLERLQVVRVYAKPPGKEPDMSSPFVLKMGQTVGEFARQIHKDLYDNLKSARVWGSTAFDGQMVSREYVLQDGDVIELRA